MAEAPRDVEHIFTMLLQNQHRWKDVAFHCNHVVFSPRFPGFNLTNMPLLTSMQLDTDRFLKPTADFTHSLRLRSLDVRNGTFDLVTDNLPLTLERIRLFSSDIRCLLLCLTFLRATPHLRELCVYSWDYSTPPLSNEDRVEHSNLNDLHLCTGSNSKLPAMIIGAVTIPSLKTMSYTCNVGSEALLRFFQRSTPPLTKMDIECSDASEEMLIGILRLLPTLRDLRLARMALSEWFFR